MPNSKRVFLVDDDDMLRESLADQFADGGFEPVGAASAAEARNRVLDGLYEFMILDVRESAGSLKCAGNPIGSVIP